MDVSKKYVEKMLSQDVYRQKMKSWWGRDTDQNISARSLTLLIFAVGWALCGRPCTARTRVSDAAAVIKCFNPSKLYPLSGKIFRKWFASYFLFIHKHLIIVWSPAVNLIAVVKFYWHPVYITASKQYLRRTQIIFMLLESVFHWLFCLIFSYILVTFSKTYARKEVYRS